MPKGKDVPVGAMKSNRSWGKRLIILNTGTRKRQVVILTPGYFTQGNKAAVLKVQYAGWAPELSGRFGKYMLLLPEIEPPDRSIATTPATVRTSRPSPSYYTSHLRTSRRHPSHYTTYRTKLQTVAYPLHHPPYEPPDRILATTPATVRTPIPCYSLYTNHRTLSRFLL